MITKISDVNQYGKLNRVKTFVTTNTSQNNRNRRTPLFRGWVLLTQKKQKLSGVSPANKTARALRVEQVSERNSDEGGKKKKERGKFLLKDNL